MKNWKIIAAVAVALIVLIVTPLSVMAAGGQAATPASTPQTPKVHLAIVQPWVVRVGQQMQLTVFERQQQTPIEGAKVWAIARDDTDTVRQAITALAKKAQATEQDYEAILSSRGTLLGATDANGHLLYNFNEPARDWLATYKSGYLPGFSTIMVREVLAISAPRKAVPGDAVTVTVTQKGTTEPVGGASVWAIDFASAQALKDKLAALKAAIKGNPQSADYDAALHGIAISLGATNDAGQVTQAFDKGRYLLITVKPGCTPAYAAIVVAPPAITPTPTPQSNSALN